MSDANDPIIEPNEVIDATEDDLVDIDGAPDDPLAAVLGGGGFDLGALMEQASAMQTRMIEAQQHAAETVLEGVAGGGAVKVAITGAFEPRSVSIDASAVDPDDVEMLQDLVLAALRHAVDQANALQQGALGGGIDLPDLGGMFGN